MAQDTKQQQHIYVAAVSGKTVYLSEGTKAGFKPGDQIEIRGPILEVTHPVTKEKLGTTAPHRAHATIKTVGDKMAEATVETGPTFYGIPEVPHGVAVGDIVVKRLPTQN
jgi:hypothetical protein